MHPKLSTKRALEILESAEVLPKLTHLAPCLESAALAMRRSPIWLTVSPTSPEDPRGSRVIKAPLPGHFIAQVGNVMSGETPWK